MKNPALSNGHKYVKDLLSQESFYNIPEYQRPYVWGEEQIQDLLNDISTAMENDSSKEYFLGCMIWNTRKIEDKNGSYDCQDILDGQQRFISLYLLHAVLRDLSDDSELRMDVNKGLFQKENKFKGIPNRVRIDFEIREDGAFLEKFVLKENQTLPSKELKEISESSKSSISVQNMATALLTMHDWWEKKKQEKQPDFLEYLGDFYVYLSNKVMALYLATPDNLDDAYNLFTVLNSRGLKLQVSDILRAQNLSNILDDAERKKYAQKWSSYEDAIGEPFQSFDAFLWTFVYTLMKYSSDQNKTIKAAFDFMLEKGTLKKGQHTIDMVGRYVNHFEAINEGNFDSETLGCFFSNINFILKTTFGDGYMMPMMYYRECFGEYRITEMLLKIDNLLSTAWLMGHKFQQPRLFGLLKKMDYYVSFYKNLGLSTDKAADQFLEDETLKYEYKDEKFSAQAINLSDFFDALDTYKWGSYSGTKINKTRYLLLKLDVLMSNLNTRLQFNAAKMALVHLMPRKININDGEISANDHEKWVHCLGNIVLVDKRKSISMSDASYEVKIQKYKGSIDTRANTSYVFTQYKQWNIETIKTNHERILNIFKSYYTGNNLEELKKIKGF